MPSEMESSAACSSARGELEVRENEMLILLGDDDDEELGEEKIVDKLG